jgi:hypothetical protein
MFSLGCGLQMTQRLDMYAESLTAAVRMDYKRQIITKGASSQ